MSDLDTIRERHRVIVSLDGRDICPHCQERWPCDTRVVLDALDKADAASIDDAAALKEAVAIYDAARADADRLAEAGRILLSLLEDSLNADAITACGPMRHALRQHEEAERER